MTDEKRDGEFSLTITLGNAAMSEPEHVAEALADVAEAIRDGGGWLEGTIRDGNGNTVGRYLLGDEPKRGDSDALDRIAERLDGSEWSADDCEAVAGLVRDTGREIREIDDLAGED